MLDMNTTKYVENRFSSSPLQPGPGLDPLLKKVAKN